MLQLLLVRLPAAVAVLRLRRCGGRNALVDDTITVAVDRVDGSVAVSVVSDCVGYAVSTVRVNHHRDWVATLLLGCQGGRSGVGYGHSGLLLLAVRIVTLRRCLLCVALRRCLLCVALRRCLLCVALRRVLRLSVSRLLLLLVRHAVSIRVVPLRRSLTVSTIRRVLRLPPVARLGVLRLGLAERLHGRCVHALLLRGGGLLLLLLLLLLAVRVAAH